MILIKNTTYHKFKFTETVCCTGKKKEEIQTIDKGSHETVPNCFFNSSFISEDYINQAIAIFLGVSHKSRKGKRGMGKNVKAIFCEVSCKSEENLSVIQKRTKWEMSTTTGQTS